MTASRRETLQILQLFCYLGVFAASCCSLGFACCSPEYTDLLLGVALTGFPVVCALTALRGDGASAFLCGAGYGVAGFLWSAVVEAELVVGAVGDVGGIGLFALGAVQAVDHQADGEAEVVVHLAHPLGVAAGQVVIDGDHMDALALEGVEIAGQGGDEGLALAGLHLGDPALVEHQRAEDLHREVLHLQHAPAGLPAGGKGLGEDILEGLAGGETGPERIGHAPELGIAHRREFFIQSQHFIDGGLKPFDLFL